MEGGVSFFVVAISNTEKEQWIGQIGNFAAMQGRPWSSLMGKWMIIDSFNIQYFNLPIR
jgi:hypothetical protein